MSQPADSASRLSARTYARRCVGVRCANSMQGTSFIPSFRAASTRPCPAMMPFSPSTSTGFVQPNSRMLAAIWATCSSLWVRAFRAYGISDSMDRFLTLIVL